VIVIQEYDIETSRSKECSTVKTNLYSKHHWVNLVNS